MNKIEHPLLGSFIFVHSTLDDAGLSANEFRVYAHIARRAGNGTAFPAVASIAEVCRIHKDTVWAVLRSLEERGMVVRIARTGAANIYRLTDPKAWTNPSKAGSGKEGAPEMEGLGAPENKGCPPPETEGYEGTPTKDIQRRTSTTRIDSKPMRPPTEAEWVAYCKETWPDWYTSVDAWTRYEALGWTLGKSKIKSWKAAARTSYGYAKTWGKLGQPSNEHDEFWRNFKR